MKTQNHLTRPRLPRHGLLTLTIALALAGPSVWAKKPPKPPPEPESGYRLVDLVGPSGGQSVARRINNAGWVVGETPQPDPFGNEHAFVVVPEDRDGDGIPDVWARDDNGDGLNDLLIDLGTLGGNRSWAYGINDLGQVVGSSDVDEWGAAHAFLWQPTTGEMLDLGTMDNEWSVAWGINNLGQVVGQSGGRAFLINPLDTDDNGIPDTWFSDDGQGFNDLMIDLGSLFGGNVIATDINDLGEIVGVSAVNAPVDGYGFLIRPADVDADGIPDTWFAGADGINDLMIMLPPSGRSTFSFATAINAEGLILGYSGTGDDVVLWLVDPTGVVSQFSLGGIQGKKSTIPEDLNDAGQGVGAASSSLGPVFPPKSSSTAWLLENGTLSTLPDLIVDWGPFTGGFERACGINNRGEIVGEAEWHACIAVPIQ